MAAQRALGASVKRAHARFHGRSAWGAHSIAPPLCWHCQLQSAGWRAHPATPPAYLYLVANQRPRPVKSERSAAVQLASQLTCTQARAQQRHLIDGRVMHPAWFAGERRLELRMLGDALSVEMMS